MDLTIETKNRRTDFFVKLDNQVAEHYRQKGNFVLSINEVEVNEIDPGIKKEIVDEECVECSDDIPPIYLNTFLNPGNYDKLLHEESSLREASEKDFIMVEGELIKGDDTKSQIFANKQKGECKFVVPRIEEVFSNFILTPEFTRPYLESANYFTDDSRPSEDNQLTARNISNIAMTNQQHLAIDEQSSCVLCKRTLYSASEKEEHMKMHSEEPCHCITCFPKQLFPAPTVKAAVNILQCRICKMTFENLTFLHTHMVIHNLAPFSQIPTENGIACKFCNLQFSKLDDLLEHNKVHVEKFECIICKRSFANHTLFVAHMQLYHDHKPSHKCDICEKIFKGSKTLTLRSHRYGSKYNFQCISCKSGFQENFNFAAHLITHEHLKKAEIINCFFESNKITYEQAEILTTRIKEINLPYQGCKNTTTESSYTLEPSSQISVAENKQKHSAESKSKTNEAQMERTMVQEYSVDNLDATEVPIAKLPRYEPRSKPTENKKVCRRKSTYQEEPVATKTNSGKNQVQYQCQCCLKDFTSKILLLSHLVEHNAGSNLSDSKRNTIFDKPYKCNKCNRRYKTSKSLDYHKITHGS